MRNTVLIGLSFLFIAETAMGQTYEKTEYGVKASLPNMSMEVQFYSPEIVRILKSPQNLENIPHSYSVVKTPGNTSFEVEKKGDDVVLKTRSIQVLLNMKTGQVEYADSVGNLLLEETEKGTQFTPVVYNKKSTYLVRQAFSLTPDEAIYGLGQQQGKMNQRNQSVWLRQENMEIAIPFFQSTLGYGVFWDNAAYTMFTDNTTETAFDSKAGSCVDYYFMYGGNSDKVIARMRELTGQVPMQALWTYGFWQSRERYTGQEELLDVVKKYRELQVPLDVIVQDWQYWGTDAANWNAIEFNNPKFPDAKKMVEDVHNMNAHIAISIWPTFGYKSKLYKTFEKKNMLLTELAGWPAEARPYDPFNPEARQIYWEAIRDNMYSIGIDAWWLDATEPELTQKDYYKIKQETYAGPYQYVANAFPIVSVGGVYENQRKEFSDKRVSILTRSAFAGQQRYGANSWSGDIQSTWEVLHKQIAAGLNFSLSGLPYWNTDIGGFVSCTYPEGSSNPAYRELYVRWNQFGAFTPMMRSHGTCSPREIYQFGERGTWAFDAIEKYIRLRYRLMPYIYATAWDVTSQNGTFMRALVMDFPRDKKVYDMGDEYLFGRSLLVAPVTKPMYVSEDRQVDLTNTGTKQVYLPAGTEWYDFWTGERLQGAQTVEKEVPIDIMPIYVKAGSILPVGPDVQFAAEKPWDELEIRVYPGADGEFVLYEDEQDNYNYEKGMYTTISFNWNDAKKTLTIRDREGKYPGMLKNRKFRIVLVDSRKGCGDGLTRKVDKVVTYKGNEVRVKL